MILARDIGLISLGVIETESHKFSSFRVHPATPGAPLGPSYSPQLHVPC